MNKLIKSILYDKALFFDIETASQFKDLDENSDTFRVFRYKYRDKDTEELLSVEETKKLYNKIAALSPIFGRVISVTFGYIQDEKIAIKSYSGDEHEILSDTIELLKKSRNRLLIGFNSNGFDLVYLRKRCIINKIEFPEHLMDVGKKPWELDTSVMDLMKLWQGTDPYRNSLDELCLAFNIPSPKIGEVKGSEVSSAFHSGRINEIVAYCEEDVKATINLMRAFRFENYLV